MAAIPMRRFTKMSYPVPPEMAEIFSNPEDFTTTDVLESINALLVERYSNRPYRTDLIDESKTQQEKVRDLAQAFFNLYSDYLNCAEALHGKR